MSRGLRTPTLIILVGVIGGTITHGLIGVFLGPVVLAVLCVAGVLAGVVMRVRAFLFLGVGFLLLDLFAMIWYVAVDRAQPWVWYASGIVLGAAILALFAVFEKRRNDVLGLVDRLRQWD